MVVKKVTGDLRNRKNVLLVHLMLLLLVAR